MTNGKYQRCIGKAAHYIKRCSEPSLHSHRMRHGWPVHWHCPCCGKEFPTWGTFVIHSEAHPETARLWGRYRHLSGLGEARDTLNQLREDARAFQVELGEVVVGLRASLVNW